jgi:hypothetical protein
MNKLEMIKGVVTLIVSVGVGGAVGNVIKNTTPVTVGAVKKLCIGVGAVVLSNMVGDKAVEYVEEKINVAAQGIKTLLGEKIVEKDTEVQE